MWLLNGKNNGFSNARRENRTIKALGSAVKLKSQKMQAAPLVLASPHSGRHYPDSFLAMSRLSLDQLRMGEDAFIDQLIEPLSRFGIPTLAAEFPRSFVDVNRSPEELPPEYAAKTKIGQKPVSSRARAGLGVVPSKIAQNMEIYKHPLTYLQARSRIERFYKPYHAQLTQLLEQAHRQFGRAVLIDCHSMPGRGPSGEKRADIILGDRFGKSCRADLTTHLEQVFTSHGYSVTRNHPYAGGYVTHHYGNPDLNIDAIQIEINKDLYLNPVTMETHSGMKKLAANFEKAILQVLEPLLPAANIAAQ
ncbi:MAG: N-formylglutamate amidohydrolase [Acidimicrobiales bacterium]|nr:N-formylglutamate amidohydrolase [Hyphomonadaceae bacterium]RZV44864.1 MAG: N-formylglutamate amidohydrolase [Acidimicrobiales bacterium]